MKPGHRTHLHDLRARLETLPLHLDSLDVHTAAVSLGDYPDGPRPTSTLVARGAGLAGFGEHVGWTDDEHEAFRDNAGRCARGATTLGAWSRGLSTFPAYDRAALEAAGLDLALRQNRTTLFEVA